jgi:hypothetical protein
VRISHEKIILRANIQKHGQKKTDIPDFPGGLEQIFFHLVEECRLHIHEFFQLMKPPNKYLSVAFYKKKQQKSTDSGGFYRRHTGGREKRISDSDSTPSNWPKCKVCRSCADKH